MSESKTVSTPVKAAKTIAEKANAKANPLKSGAKDELKSPYEIVVMGEATRRFKDNMWKGMVRQAVISVKASRKAGVIDGKEQRAAFEAVMRDGEEQYMKKYHGKNADAKNTKGDWKFREYLPSSYRTAKSVAVNCIEHAVRMTNGDDVVGKTACEDAYRLKTAVPAAGTNAKTPQEKWGICVELMDKIMPTLSDKDYEVATMQLRTRGLGTRKTAAVA